MGNTFTDGQASSGSASRLITLDDAKAHLGVTAATDDAVIGNLIDAAQEAMRRHCGRRLLSESVAEILDGNGKRNLWLAEPAESVTSVHESSSQTWDATTLVDATDYTVDGCQLDHYDEVWLVGRRNVRVVYLAGFATTPEDLTQACRAQVGVLYAEWQRTKAGLDVVSAERQETWSRNFLPRAALDPAVAEICDRYLSPRL